VQCRDDAADVELLAQFAQHDADAETRHEEAVAER
jgi:hypothetical protein